MPPRLPRYLSRPVQVHCNRLSQLCASFTTSLKVCANDPTASLLDMLDETKPSRPLPSSVSLPSRRPQESSSDINPSLFGGRPRPSRLPQPAEGDSSDSSTPFIQTLKRTLPPPNARTREAARREAVSASRTQTRAIENQMSRTWHAGDIYAPHDLSPVEQAKARRAKLPPRSNAMAAANTRKKGGKDVLDDLGIDPLKEYKNFAMMSEFVTEMGRIRHSRDTGLRAVNQRRMAKAVRRAIGMGIMPSVHRHPELMEERVQARSQGGRRR